jgi:hypothetical protein
LSSLLSKKKEEGRKDKEKDKEEVKILEEVKKLEEEFLLLFSKKEIILTEILIFLSQAHRLPTKCKKRNIPWMTFIKSCFMSKD